MRVRLRRDQSAGYLVNWAGRLLARAVDRKLKILGVSSGQLPVFFALAERPSLSQKALTQAAAIEQPTMAATLSRMARDGLIERRLDPSDGRGTLISLTPAAAKKARLIMKIITETNAEALQGLGKRDQEMFLEMLRRVIATLERTLSG